MTPENFCYWLQGFIELNGNKSPTSEQWALIIEHINLVFNKVTPELKEDKRIDLSELLKKIEDNNKHKEIEWPTIMPTKPFDTKPWKPLEWPWDPNFPPIITC